ncbi:hypothetical protein ILUMI_09856 [Ignelater luminosus]|uniref:Uncharacterized protein n=1 Tax=Ignelater luminosus TaxID=2038154 RepID=A0A8K0D506_IGNLU|nr:hypothetical protein ILUMI_09856 [Ignelater luminosus]
MSSNKKDDILLQLSDGTNYDKWKFRLNLFLEMKECNEVILYEQKPSTITEDAWKKKEIKAENYIVNTITNTQLKLIISEMSAKKMIKKFDEIYLTKNSAMKLLCKRKLLDLKMQENEDPTDFFDKFEKQRIKEFWRNRESNPNWQGGYSRNPSRNNLIRVAGNSIVEDGAKAESTSNSFNVEVISAETNTKQEAQTVEENDIKWLLDSGCSDHIVNTDSIKVKSHRFVEYIKLMQNQTGKKIKEIHYDNGRECINKDFFKLAKAEGIYLRTGPPHTHELNGVAERAPTHAEYYGLADCVQEIIPIKGILTDLGVTVNSPIKIYKDNTGAIALAKNGKFSKNSKHFVHDYEKRKLINVQKISTENQIANIFTKSLGRIKFQKLRTLLD